MRLKSGETSSYLYGVMEVLRASFSTQVAICNLQPSVRMTLEIVQLDREFDILESLEAVLKH
jgi:anti-anti-sigma regulatory factor